MVADLGFLFITAAFAQPLPPVARASPPVLASWRQTRGTVSRFLCSGLHRMPPDVLRPSELGFFGTSPPSHRDLSLPLPTAPPHLCRSRPALGGLPWSWHSRSEP